MQELQILCTNKTLSLWRWGRLPFDWQVKQFTSTLLYNTNLLFCVKKEIREEKFPSAYELSTFHWRHQLRPEMRGVGSRLQFITYLHSNTQRLDWTAHLRDVLITRTGMSNRKALNLCTCINTSCCALTMPFQVPRLCHIKWWKREMESNGPDFCKLWQGNLCLRDEKHRKKQRT